MSERLVLIYKHSDRCSLCEEMMPVVEAVVAAHPELTYQLVNVIEERSVSDGIAERTGIKHESPQVILMRGEEVLYHASHQKIDRRALEAALDVSPL